MTDPTPGEIAIEAALALRADLRKRMDAIEMSCPYCPAERVLVDMTGGGISGNRAVFDCPACNTSWAHIEPRIVEQFLVLKARATRQEANDD